LISFGGVKCMKSDRTIETSQRTNAEVFSNQAHNQPKYYDYKKHYYCTKMSSFKAFYV
jgi:hypothetical protein